MSLISIKRYLDQFSPEREAKPAVSLPAAACGVLLNEVDARLLADSGYAELRPQWGSLTQMLESLGEPGDLAGFHAQVSTVLAERHRLEAARQQTQGQDVRQMLGVLNDALLSLASGSEGSMDRLRRVETSLHRTSQLNDLVAMKASLTETMRMVQKETELTRVEGAGALKKLDAELQKARTASQRLPGLPGKAEAVKAMEEAAAPGAAACLAVACQLETLRIIRSRYGAPIADDLLMAFVMNSTGQEGDQAYRWSDDAVVILHHTEESAQEKRTQLKQQFARPFEYKVMTGGRAALLTVSVRWWCSSLAESGPSSAAEEFEQFLEGRQR